MQTIITQGVPYEQLLDDLRALIRHEMAQAAPATPVSGAPAEELLTVQGAAALLNVCVATVHEWKRRGLLAYTKLGGRAYLKRADVLAELAEICAAHDADYAVVEAHSYPPSMADPDGEMLRIVQRNAEAATGQRPVPMSSLGGSDSRYWRWAGVPAYLYGPSPVTMGRGRADEHVTESDYLAVVRVHLLSAYDYLRG